MKKNKYETKNFQKIGFYYNNRALVQNVLQTGQVVF